MIYLSNDHMVIDQLCMGADCRASCVTGDNIVTNAGDDAKDKYNVSLMTYLTMSVQKYQDYICSMTTESEAI